MYGDTIICYSMVKLQLNYIFIRTITLLGGLHCKMLSHNLSNSRIFKYSGVEKLDAKENTGRTEVHKSLKGDIERILTCLILELNIAFERLAKSPVGRCNVIGCAGPSVASLDSKGQALSIEISQTLPISSPVP